MQILEHRMFIGVQCYNYLAMATLTVDAGNLLWAFWDVALLFVHVNNHDFDDIMYINERKMYISEMLVCVCISEIQDWQVWTFIMDDSLYCVGDEPLCDKEKNYYVLILHLMELLFLLQTYIQEMPKIKKNST